MRFHFSTINHDACAKSTLGDMFEWFSAGLVEAGHTVSQGPDLDMGTINVLWENFRPGMAAVLKQAGVRFGIVATEIPDGEGGLNWRCDGHWPDRWAALPEVACRRVHLVND